jgi:uncharacterized protein (TIGR02996 family)
MLEEAFLCDILENPEDDAVRLIYADWLMERGDAVSAARGEFIQTQCRITRSEGTLTDWNEWADLAAQLPRLREREKALLAEHGQSWAGPVRGLAAEYEFRRGFVENLALAASDFVSHAETLFSSAPILRIRFTLMNVAMTRLASCPYLARLQALDLRSTWIAGSAGLRALLSSSHLGCLRSLSLQNCRIGNDGVQALAESPVLGQLTALDLGGTDINREGVTALLRSRFGGQLRHLNIAGVSGMGEVEREALAAALEGTPEASRLVALLGFFDPPASALQGSHARRLARQMAEDDSRSLEILEEGLASSHRRVRAAAANMVGHLGSQALASLPTLIRRLHDRRRNGRDAAVLGGAAVALARLVPLLPEELKTWIGALVNPLRSASNNLEHVLDSARLPRVVWEDFAALCLRRRSWWDQVLKQEEPAPPLAVPVYPDHAALRLVAHEVVRLGGGDREAAWLLARLCELLQRNGC